MSAPVKLALFGAALALVFAGSALAGAAIGPEPKDEPGGAGHAESMAGHGVAPDEVRGLATAAGGLRVVVEDAELRRLFLQFQHAGEVQTVAFTQEVR